MITEDIFQRKKRGHDDLLKREDVDWRSLNSEVAKELCQPAVKGEWKKVRNRPYQAVAMDVELDIADAGKKEPKRIKVRLLFVRGIAAVDERIEEFFTQALQFDKFTMELEFK